jgi:hypothetical protein
VGSEVWLTDVGRTPAFRFSERRQGPTSDVADVNINIAGELRSVSEWCATRRPSIGSGCSAPVAHQPWPERR